MSANTASERLAAIRAADCPMAAEGGSNRTLDDILYLAGRDPIQTTLVPMYWVALTGTDVMTSATPPMSLAQAMSRIAPRPALLIAASEEPETTLIRHLASIAPDPRNSGSRPETAHTQGLATDSNEWTARVLAFLDRAIGARARAETHA